MSIGFTLKKAGWQSGYAEDCKSLYVGSIPVLASIRSHYIRLLRSHFVLINASDVAKSFGVNKL